MTIHGQRLEILMRGLQLDPLPKPISALRDDVPHAPKRNIDFDVADTKLALKNALRYFPERLHDVLAPEFLDELRTYGHIYMYRFRPTEYEMKAHCISFYPTKTKAAASIIHMIHNNLNPSVAQFPDELITYGGNGSVFSNWAQYHLVMKYLCEMSDEQTLVLYSGHPLGLFPAPRDAPRLVITNGMLIPNYSSRELYEKMYAQGVTQYGQMTAGSFCYIGPQGIVHGTTLTLLNAGRRYLGNSDLTGKVFVTSGLGGMSGAQPKAGVITKAIAVVAEIDPTALDKRHRQGWVMERIDGDLDELVQRIKRAKSERIPVSIGFLGNVVDVWERLAAETELLVDLGSDQTSLHNAFGGGYYPAGIPFNEAKSLIASDPDRFCEAVRDSLRRHVSAINKLCERGMRFWDYGNAFLFEAGNAGADVKKDNGTFKYPSYVQDIMGDIFSLGFGPFRWVCTSGDHDDLKLTDRIAADVIERLSSKAPERVSAQYSDNLLWIQKAEENALVVGSEARILYSDAEGRAEIALAFNRAVADGSLRGPVVLSRDHHDVSGTDSPWRETSNIEDGSQFCADMAVQNCIGDAIRGATWVALHNGGGTGWGEVINGGHGMVMDGSEDAARRASQMLHWDVNNGVARRAWAGNENAEFQVARAMAAEPRLVITQRSHVSDVLLDNLNCKMN